MTHLKELKKKAKEKGLKGYSTACKHELELALRDGILLRKNQKSIGTQTDFLSCGNCKLRHLINSMKKPKQRENRDKIIYDGDLETDGDTGEVLRYGVDYSRY